MKIELVEDTERAGFHHVHLRVKDPDATLAWFQDHFGGERAKLRDKVDGVRYDGVWLFAMSSGNETPASSSDHAIQNIALRVKDVDAGMKGLGGAGVKTMGERTQPAGDALRLRRGSEWDSRRADGSEPAVGRGHQIVRVRRSTDCGSRPDRKRPSVRHEGAIL